MIHYLFVCKTPQVVSSYDTLVATGTLREVTALGAKFNRCEFYVVTEQDDIVFESWVAMEPLAKTGR